MRAAFSPSRSRIRLRYRADRAVGELIEGAARLCRQPNAPRRIAIVLARRHRQDRQAADDRAHRSRLQADRHGRSPRGVDAKGCGLRETAARAAGRNPRRVPPASGPAPPRRAPASARVKAPVPGPSSSTGPVSAEISLVISCGQGAPRRCDRGDAQRIGHPGAEEDQASDAASGAGKAVRDRGRSATALGPHGEATGSLFHRRARRLRQRQRPRALAGQGKERVGEGRRHRRQAGLAEPAPRRVACHEMHLDLRRVSHRS